MFEVLCRPRHRRHQERPLRQLGQRGRGHRHGRLGEEPLSGIQTTAFHAS